MLIKGSLSLFGVRSKHTIPMATGKEVTRLLRVVAALTLICNGMARNIDLSHTMKDIPGCQCDRNDKNFNETIPDKVMIGCRKCYLFTYEFNKRQDWAANLCVKSPKASAHSPLLVVVRESLSVMSFQVPLVFSNVSPFTDVCHTLCPLANYFDSKLKPGIQNISIEVSTSSEEWVDYELELATVNDFVMVKETPIAVNITPSKPHVLQYDMEQDLRAVRIEATSKDESCMILAIQDVQCPLYDSVRTVEQGGYYQTLTRQSGISITRKTFPGGRQYVVLILKPISSSCKESGGTSSSEVQHSWKEVTVKVVPAITDREFYAAIFGALAFFILVYIFCLIICCFISFRRRRALTTATPSNAVTITCISNYGTTSDSETPASLNFCSVSINSDSSAGTDSSNGLRDVVDGRRGSRISMDEDDIDKLPEVNHDKNVVRTKTVLYVSDLARKKDRYLSERTKVFSWNLVTIAIFYGLPVVQLVYINQRIVLMTGNQDVCYYNFLCSHQAYGISD
ncbi:SID1 transmembrane family member 2, partial [Stegodyphus mimosarum]